MVIIDPLARLMESVSQPSWKGAAGTEQPRMVNPRVKETRIMTGVVPGGL